MLEVFGHPILEYVLAGLASAGFREVTVNAAWLAGAFAVVPELGRRFGLDVSLSVQEKPLEHGGDLAFARPFLDSLAPEEVFLAINGDTIVEIEAAELQAVAGTVTAEAPVLLLGTRTPDGPLRAGSDGVLAGIGDISYVPAVGDAERWDDAGLKLMHASVRDAMPAPGTRMSLHGTGGLLGRLASQGKEVRVAQAPLRARYEIGTLEDYRSLADDDGLRKLTTRLVGGRGEVESER
jgi:NDP-sugar pyrophosphorylase family protein